MAAIPSREVTTAQVAAVTFGFYSDAEVRKLSAKQITVPQAYDALKNAQPGGPYDKALGPLEQHDSCATCGLRYVACPGHFGHVELAVPVYNPLVFMSLFKLLRFTCLHCFKLKLKQSVADLYARKFALLAEGRLAEALAAAIPGRGRGKAGADGDGGGGAAEDAAEPSLEQQKAAAQLAAKLAALDDAAASSSKAGGGRARRGAGAPRDGAAAAARAPGLRAARGPETSLTVEATKAAVGAFFRQCATPKGRCENCGAYNPTLRRRARPRLAWEGFSKIFQQPLSSKSAAENARLGVRLTSALTVPATSEARARPPRRAAPAGAVL